MVRYRRASSRAWRQGWPGRTRPRVHAGTSDGVPLCRSRQGRWPLLVTRLSVPLHPAVDCRRCMASARRLARGAYRPGQP